MSREAKYDKCWLRHEKIKYAAISPLLKSSVKKIMHNSNSCIAQNAAFELRSALETILEINCSLSNNISNEGAIFLINVSVESDYRKTLSLHELEAISNDGYLVKSFIENSFTNILIASASDTGLLYGAFALIRLIQISADATEIYLLEKPACKLRMINHWDNLDGSIERGYAGKSFLYENGHISSDKERIRDYARLLASIGINSIVINNVNVHSYETTLIDERLEITKRLSDIFRLYGIKTFLSINYASPVDSGALNTADPQNLEVQLWWKNVIAKIYGEIPDFGGFLVKADSEHIPGPHTYGRNHAEGANMLADILKEHEGLLIWRCFVYNCTQNWRDRITDRAKAAYDIYKPLDGEFRENVVLQVKNGPMDFQVREPVSPLLGAMPKTSQLLELQITQEYTGQQKHLCYLVPQWKEVLNFNTHTDDEASLIEQIISGKSTSSKFFGMAAIANVGNDFNWTGHYLAQSNLYGYGRLLWNPSLSAETIANEWIVLTFGNDKEVADTIEKMLLDSWQIYESYTSPLGIGWMVNPGHHYGPSVDGYEYSKWGTYHRADSEAIGVDRTSKGTGYTLQYSEKNMRIYESKEKCPEELLLFFHRLPYSYVLKSGKTLIQHIYDSHFKGVNEVEQMIENWSRLSSKIDVGRFSHVLNRLNEQLENSKEWRDVVNSYFYRKTGISDYLNREIF